MNSIITSGLNILNPHGTPKKSLRGFFNISGQYSKAFYNQEQAMMASIWYSKLKTTENKMKKGPASINGMRIIWGYFWFPKGKKISETIFLLYFFKAIKMAKPDFQFFSKIFYLVPQLQSRAKKYRKFGLYVVKWQQEKWACHSHDAATPLSSWLQVTEDFF